MRVLKENTVTYESFHETLPNFTRDTLSRVLKPVICDVVLNENSNIDYNENTLQGLQKLQEKINNANKITDLEKHFAEFINESLKIGEANLFFLDEKRSVIESVSYNASIRTKAFINSLLTSGVINEIIDKKKCIKLPDNLLRNYETNKAYYLLMPFLCDSRISGCLVVNIDSSLDPDSPEISMLKIGLDIISSRIEMMDKQQELKNALNELQLIQSRLANDYKLSAIGELTTGILDDILSPLQVIMSYADLMKKEDNSDFNSVMDTINLQAKKINRVVGRLINFAKPVEGKLKLEPCDLNDTIIEFYEVVNSSLKNDNYECILDLDENMPGILSHPNYIHQLLMNIFLLLKPSDNKAGGVLLQSKFQEGNAIIKFFTTDYFSNLESNAIAATKDVNVKIILNLMRQHQGELSIDSDKNKGTIISISFPIKRKM